MRGFCVPGCRYCASDRYIEALQGARDMRHREWGLREAQRITSLFNLNLISAQLGLLRLGDVTDGSV